ncbi:MAG: hypothetical protein HZR80_13490 [Candidatus Heimdallarchaeota archaeon]
MDSSSAMSLYILIVIIVALIANIIFYRLVFKKKKRKKANLFSWLTTLGIMVPISLGLVFPFARAAEFDDPGGGIGFALLMFAIILPAFWFLPTTIYLGIRAIFIAITKRREREIISDTIVNAELTKVEED